MKGLTVGLLIAAGVIVLIVGAAGTVFYVRVYRPITGPLTAMVGARTLEEMRLRNAGEFEPPASGELTTAQVAGFVTVEEAVHDQLATGNAVLAQARAELEGASEGGGLSVQAVLAAFGDIKRPYLSAKVAQIDAMNRASFSKEEYEWVRGQLYSAARLRLSQLDVGDLATGVRGATVRVRQSDLTPGAPERNVSLARPLAEKLQAWLTLAFFGL